MKNMTNIDREGIFRAIPISWGLKESGSSQALAINIEFLIQSQLVGDDEWTDWTQYADDYRVFGDFWVIGKTGAPNSRAVEDLVRLLGWSGNLTDVNAPPPGVLLQVNVQGEEHKGKTYFKVAWINPADHVPQSFHANDQTVQQKAAQYGSLLRACAAAVPATTAAPAPQPAQPAQPEPVPEGAPTQEPAPNDPPHPAADSSPTDPTADLPF